MAPAAAILRNNKSRSMRRLELCAQKIDSRMVLNDLLIVASLIECKQLSRVAGQKSWVAGRKSRVEKEGKNSLFIL